MSSLDWTFRLVRKGPIDHPRAARDKARRHAADWLAHSAKTRPLRCGCLHEHFRSNVSAAEEQRPQSVLTVGWTPTDRPERSSTGGHGGDRAVLCTPSRKKSAFRVPPPAHGVIGGIAFRSQRRHTKLATRYRQSDVDQWLIDTCLRLCDYSSSTRTTASYVP